MSTLRCAPWLAASVLLASTVCVADTGAACYQLSPVDAQMSCWLLKDQAIEFYDVNGTLTYD